MNAPAAGWNPDPTGRHEYRYWNGGTWTDDVSDNGVASVDPVGGHDPSSGDPTERIDATQQYAPQPGPQPGGYGPQPGPPPGGYGPSHPSGSGQFPPGPPVKSGPSTGLLVGLAAVAVALIAGIAFVLTSGGDDGDDTATDETSNTEDTATEDTATDDTATDDTSADDLDIDLDDIDEDTSDAAIVDLLAAGIRSSSDQITEEQAQCAAQAMLDELGLETIMEMSTTGTDPFADGSLTTEQQVAIVTAMTDCIPVDVLMDIGLEAEG
jgi:hypothetical protein